MKVENTIDIYMQYLKDNTRPNTFRSFGYPLAKFKAMFSGKNMSDISETNIIEFVSSIFGGSKQSTKCSRIGSIRAFFNFVIDVADDGFSNPCLRPMVKKLFKSPKFTLPKLLEKDTIDEIIFRTTDERNRLILELMGRAGMRIGEVLNIRPCDINSDNSTVLIIEPKSGRSNEKVYLPKKLSTKLQAFASSNGIKDTERVFPISYSTAYRMVRRAGGLANSFLRPHDLRRHAATHASRSNIPLEVVSKVILRHADIATTQRYLGTIDPNEASRWVEHLNR